MPYEVVEENSYIRFMDFGKHPWFSWEIDMISIGKLQKNSDTGW